MVERDSALVVFEPQNYSLAKERISRNSIGVITFWFGKRISTGDDLRKFDQTVSLRRCCPIAQFEIKDADRVENAYPALVEVDFNIRQVIARERIPLAIFVVLTPQLAECPWTACMKEGLQRLRKGKEACQYLFIKLYMVPFLHLGIGGRKT